MKIGLLDIRALNPDPRCWHVKEVRVNGEVLKNCVSANDIEGWATFISGSDGFAFMHNTVRGEVEFIFKDGYDPSPTSD